MFYVYDFAAFDRPGHLHLAFQAVQQFRAKHNKWPGLSESDINETIALAEEINNKHKSNENAFKLEAIDDEVKRIIRNTAQFSDRVISPMVAFFGGIVAQEIVKITGKYTPISQFLHFEAFLSAPTGEVDRTLHNTRYDDQVAIFGNELQKKLGDLEIFMVGAGALGCEYVKAYAMMGIGCGPKGKVICTDNDNIEVSNLNRQFLFRQNNVGTPKSKTALEIGVTMNKDLHAESLQKFVSPDTEDIFNDTFWNRLSFVVNAVDNVKARQYVDQRCVWFKKALLESGTLGTKANSQMVIPHLTECYSDSQDPPEDSVPMCTLRNFPNQIEHTIEWGRAAFNDLFVDKAAQAKDYLDKP